jgi:hypothetical protein
MDPAVVSKVGGALAACRIWGKLASRRGARHEVAMRRFILVAVLALAACAPRVQQPAPVVFNPVARPPSGVLIGLTASELGQRFGQPTFQVREGSGTKLQWSENGCVLDAYLYPPETGRGADRVVHVDARNASGVDMNIDSCLALLAR